MLLVWTEQKYAKWFCVDGGDGEEESVLLVVICLLLFCLNPQTNSGGTGYVFLQYPECTPAMNELVKKLGYVYLMWGTTYKVYHSTVAAHELNNRKELNALELCGVEPFSAIRGLAQIVQGSYGAPSLSRAPHRPYHFFYINGFYRDF